jgi:hypothetical protein
LSSSLSGSVFSSFILTLKRFWKNTFPLFPCLVGILINYFFLFYCTFVNQNVKLLFELKHYSMCWLIVQGKEKILSNKTVWDLFKNYC